MYIINENIARKLLTSRTYVVFINAVIFMLLVTNISYADNNSPYMRTISPFGIDINTSTLNDLKKKYQILETFKDSNKNYTDHQIEFDKSLDRNLYRIHVTTENKTGIVRRVILYFGEYAPDKYMDIIKEKYKNFTKINNKNGSFSIIINDIIIEIEQFHFKNINMTISYTDKKYIEDFHKSQNSKERSIKDML